MQSNWDIRPAIQLHRGLVPNVTACHPPMHYRVGFSLMEVVHSPAKASEKSLRTAIATALSQGKQRRGKGIDERRDRKASVDQTRLPAEP